MRTLITALLAFTVSGCTSKPTFHITSTDPCADVSITGTIQGREYALAKPPGHDYMACYGRMTPKDVGTDVPAEIDPRAGEITLTMDGEKQVFEIEATREAK